MNGFLPDPMDWMRAVVEMQKAQLNAAEKMMEVGTSAMDPAKLEVAKQELEQAGQRAVDAAQNWAEAQWTWLNLWRC